MSTGTNGTSETPSSISAEPGVPLIALSTPLRRLNYFDGKFLRAADLTVEQQYLRQLVALSNQAGGAGVAYGFDLLPATGDDLQIGAGLAIDPDGYVVLLPQARVVNATRLIDQSKRVAAAALPPSEGAP